LPAINKSQHKELIRSELNTLLKPGSLISAVMLSTPFMVMIPKFLLSSKTYVGLSLQGGVVVIDEEIAKSRYIIITIAPFLIGSINLPFLLGVFVLLTPSIKLLLILNAMS